MDPSDTERHATVPTALREIGLSYYAAAVARGVNVDTEPTCCESGFLPLSSLLRACGGLSHRFEGPGRPDLLPLRY